MDSRLKTILDRLVMGVLVAFVVGVLLLWYAGGEMTESAARAIGRPPLPLGARNVTFASASGSLIHGWMTNGTPGQGTVLLLHGLRGDRREMLARAGFLHRLGYGVLLIDFQAHGESRGSVVTFGDLESRDVVAALQYLHHELPQEPLAVLGVSLGAAAYVLAADGRAKVSAVVLDSLYPTVDEAMAQRMRRFVGPVAPLLAPLLVMQLHPRLGIDPDKLRPLARMDRVDAPVLMISGARDPNTLSGLTQSMYSSVPEPKELWIVAGAGAGAGTGREDLQRDAPAEYERRVGDFLARYLSKS